MTKLWKPTKARSRSIQTDMRRQVLPNPYHIREDDIGLRVFGTRITEDDIGIKCQLVLADDGVTPVFQMENRHQMLTRTAQENS